MSIDLSHDTILPLGRAREWLGGRLGREPSAKSFRRWISVGVKDVVLESILVGGRRYVSVEAIERFVARLSGGGAEPSPTARRRREIAAAKVECDRIFGARGGGR